MSASVINTQIRTPELMSPAGDWEAMRAAVANGANAVYFGLNNFNARHRAANFGIEELPAIMEYLHSHNVKGFLTFNTLIFSNELPEAVQYIRKIAEAGVDAIIVQDLGLVRLASAAAPGLPIHGSTQMTLTEARGIEFVRKLGVERVVLARELSLDEIRRISSATDIELEVFVHGALCVAYSGQCLTSESLGGRSANRGQCAQACRLPYDLVVDGQIKELGDRAYLLSPQDLAAYDLVGDLAEAGVACLKIEGRLKSAHYVAATTRTYRQAIDAAREQSRFSIAPRQRADLEQTFSRGFSHGFLSGVNHQVLVPGRFPKSRGIRIGTVIKILPKSLILSIDPKAHATLKPGDGVVFDQGHPEQDEQGGRVFAVRQQGRDRIEIELGRGDVNLAAIDPGALVWKTDDPALRKRLEHSFSRDFVVNRIPLTAAVTAKVGGQLSIRFSDEINHVEVGWDRVLEVANKFPLSEALLKEQLSRLGDSPYELTSLTADITGGPMVPKSVLNDLRRQAVDKLLAMREARARKIATQEDVLEQLRSEITSSPRSDRNSGYSEPRIVILTRTLEQLDAVLAWQHELKPSMVYCDFEDIPRYKDAVIKAKAAGIPIALATLRVVKPHEHGLLRQILDCQPDAVVVRNLAALSFYQELAPQFPQIGDYSLNISNELTAGIFADAGLIRMVPSYDLNWQQLAAMLGRFDPSRFECVVHQHMPMFHMEHCVFAHTLSNGRDHRDCGRPCDRHQVDLKDRVGEPHPLIPDVGCRNTVYNAKAQSAAEYVPEMRKLGIHYFRIELLRETAGEVGPLLDRYADVLIGKSDPKATFRSLRVLKQLGVTGGTLERE